MRAQQRAAGNHREDAVRIGRTLFRTVWPAQIRKVRVDGVGSHRVAGVVLSGTNFHSKLAPAAFVDEVVAIVTQTFAASDVEEVDAWAILPLPTYANEVVAGDLAQPTSYTVFFGDRAPSRTRAFRRAYSLGDRRLLGCGVAPQSRAIVVEAASPEARVASRRPERVQVDSTLCWRPIVP